MMVKDFKINRITISLMTKTSIKATKTFNFNPKRIIVTNLLEITLPKRILVKVKRKKISFPPSKRKISPTKIKINLFKKLSKWPKYPIMVE